MAPVYAKINTDDKRRIYESYVRGEDYVDVARLLNVKRTTAYNIDKRAEQNHGQIERPRGGHRHAKVTDAMRAVVRAVVEEHPDFTIRNIIGNYVPAYHNHLQLVKPQSVVFWMGFS
ncbi:hypothetical protein PoB_006962000 [Plakobranchus ocellatus]|uniref:Uncharacterized protein n=1 Tax=Plakobranchus ocellatus TaxID=259542 RepID=A0AAV4DGJ7_9GAST|nr:hypothetical protein PoB_006962000 [Plakobranchus ocellatus]